MNRLYMAPRQMDTKRRINMKKAKKLIAIAILSVMCIFALAGCSSEADKWENMANGARNVQQAMEAAQNRYGNN